MWTKASATRAARWLRAGHWLLGLLGLLWACAACDPVGNITVDAPATGVANDAFYVDTLTVRVATVWHDSVLTSASDNLLVGRYQAPRLGTITARSYFQVGLGAAYIPASDEVYDSLVLVLKPDAYRYGDTTQLQNLEVHRLRDALVPTKNYYAFSQLGYDAAALNQGRSTRPFAARPSVRTLRLRLADALGRELLSAGLAGSLNTDAELNNRLAGLVLAPGSTDDAALLRTQLSTEGGALNLYTHSPIDPGTVITKAFTLASGGKHFYQVTSDRTGTLLAPLSASLQALDVARTAQEAYIDGALGWQVKLEIPYLNDLRSFGSRLTIVQANLTLEVVPGSATRYLAPPNSLVAYLSTRGNQQGSTIGGSTAALAIPYQSGVSNVTGLETASYTFVATDYCQAVVDHTLDNNGILLASGAGASPERVVLGGPKRSENRLKLGLYFLTH
ncbi:DUF4270 family protein [Hymenobacter properus]|uniref:DUF4270 family protein n=1 Tax=Hymenobacter properus TaxID=2791026 RepID=A0A931FP51_9BACT|nr:DUF4270 family protein [Hymenobacter properus]MBF9143279.1 DUF4270 family protein [Hymenobacter properus]MBR7722089.1 DUF4270 family protein [Microvirga sp. SRT04]